METGFSPLSERTTEALAAQRGAAPSLIRSFEIRGLYGYRTVSMSSDYAATILIARNGSGKTTLMGALDAFLRFQLTRLQSLDFEEIRCSLRGVDQELILTRSDVEHFLDFKPTSALIKMAHEVEMPAHQLFNLVIGDYTETLRDAYDSSEDGPASSIIRKYNYDRIRAERACLAVFTSLFEGNPQLNALHSVLRVALANVEIVYLPTYRRVELALQDDGVRNHYRTRTKPKFSVKTGGLHTGEIQFGLLDISERLEEINRQLIQSSNSGYREISENIINELISGYDVDESASIPEPSDLKLFFSRLESGGRTLGPYYRISAPDFARIYSGEGVPVESRKFLRYFLSKLLGVIQVTQGLEKPVLDFVNSCNKYLSSTEPSTQLDDEAKRNRLSSFDGKALRMNPNDLSVSVESLPALRTITLDALSSGEKQMISLFAKLYLYPKKKVVLIDEPELSLSIDWQRGILVDVILAPLCEQVIAITHSPFIFENALQPFARSMKLDLDRQQQANLLSKLNEDLF